MPTPSNKSSVKKGLTIAASLAILVAIGVYVFQTLFVSTVTETPLATEPETQSESKHLSQKNRMSVGHDSLVDQSVSDIELMVNELSARLARQYANSIHLVATQVTLRGFRDDLNSVYPEQGQALFVRILTQAFPNLVKDILTALALMDEYDDWLQSMLVSLNDMDPLSQQGLIWEKRRALFGEAATQIWQEEITAEQERQITMRNAMDILDKAYDTSMQERLYLLQSTFEETYADKIQSMVIEPKGVLSQVFFGFDSVQQELSKLPPDQRQAQIDDIRRALGFPEEQVAYLAASDQKREKRWSNGHDYMAARAAAEASFTDDQLSQALDSIREKFFGHEASTIKKEEEDMNFFRYSRPRLYGRN